MVNRAAKEIIALCLLAWLLFFFVRADDARRAYNNISGVKWAVASFAEATAFLFITLAVVFSLSALIRKFADKPDLRAAYRNGIISALIVVLLSNFGLWYGQRSYVRDHAAAHDSPAP